MIPQADRSHKHKIIPSPYKANMKWLNVVLDLNGILCLYKEKKQMPKRQVYVDGLRPHSGTFSSLIALKAVFVHPSFQWFFRKLGNVFKGSILFQVSLSTFSTVYVLHVLLSVIGFKHPMPNVV